MLKLTQLFSARKNAPRYRVVRAFYANSNENNPLKYAVGSTTKKPLGEKLVPLREGDEITLVKERGIADSVVRVNGVKGRIFTTVDFLVEKGLIECFD